MLDQLDDLRPPTFTADHLAEMQRRATRMRRQRHRSWMAAAAIIAAVAVSAAIYTTPHGSSSRLQVSTVTGTPGPTNPPAASTTHQNGGGPLTDGWPPSGAGNQVVYPTADSSGFVVVNPAEHTTTNIALPGHAQINGAGLMARSGGWVGYSGTTAYFWPASLSGPGRNLGQANRVFPASSADQIWTMSQVSGPTPSDPVGAQTIREVNTDGLTTAGPFQVPPRTTPIGAVNGGIVLRTYDQYKPNQPNPPFGLELWNPQAGTTRQLQAPVTMGDAVAAGDVIAWTIADTASSSVGGGQIDLLDIATNNLHVIKTGSSAPTPPLNLRSVAPDGTQVLALGGYSSPGLVGDSPPADYRDNLHVWILDASSGTARDIGQISDPDGAAWSPNSRWIWEGLDGHLSALAADGHAAYSLPVPAPATTNGTAISVR